MRHVWHGHEEGRNLYEVFIRVLDTDGNSGGLNLMVCGSLTAVVYVGCGCVNFSEHFQGKV
jgi:hypothetical protein